MKTIGRSGYRNRDVSTTNVITMTRVDAMQQTAHTNIQMEANALSSRRKYTSTSQRGAHESFPAPSIAGTKTNRGGQTGVPDSGCGVVPVKPPGRETALFPRSTSRRRIHSGFCVYPPGAAPTPSRNGASSVRGASMHS